MKIKNLGYITDSAVAGQVHRLEQEGEEFLRAITDSIDYELYISRSGKYSYTKPVR